MSPTPSRRNMAACLIAFLVCVSVVGGAARSATAATAPDPLDVTDIRHLDFAPPKFAAQWQAAWKTTIPSSLITQFKLPSARGASQPIPSKAAANAAMSGQLSAHRVTNAGRAIADQIPKGMTVKDWLASQAAQGTKNKAALASIQKAFTVPATGVAKLAKLGVGGALGAGMVGAELGFSLGKGVSNMFGMGADQALCTPSYSDPAKLTAIVTGANCDALMNAAAEYQKNTDAPSTPSMEPVCDAARGWCVKLTKVAPFNASNTAGCWTVTGNVSNYGGYQTFVFIAGDGQASLSPISSSQIWTYDACRVGGVTGNRWSAIPATGLAGIQWNGGAVVPIAMEAQNPARQMQCTLTITSGEQFKATTAQYTEMDPKIVPPHCPAVPDGKIGGSLEIKSISPGLPDQQLYMEPTTPGYRTWATEHPECGSGLCTVDLKKLVGTERLSCFDDLAAEDCAGWFTAPNKTELYTCEYGGKAIALSECTHYAEVFKRQNTQTGQPYADPSTGEVGSPNTAPKMDEGMNTIVQDPEETVTCFPTGWAVLNPIEWVLQPVKCALQWAFVPRASVVQERTSEVMEAWRETPPGGVLTVIANWDMDFAISGCDGMQLPYVYSDFDGHSATTMLGVPSACPGEPYAEFAGWVSLVSGLGIVVVSALAIRRHAGGSIGFNA